MTKIQLGPRGYRGQRTNEQFIEPDIYEYDDEHLFGLAGFLVQTGWAIVVEGNMEDLDIDDGIEIVKADFTVLPNVGPKTQELIYDVEIYTMEDLANSDPNLLSPSIGLSIEKTVEVVAAATELVG